MLPINAVISSRMQVVAGYGMLLFNINDDDNNNNNDDNDDGVNNDKTI